MEDIELILKRMEGRLGSLERQVGEYKNILGRLYERLKEYRDCKRGCPLKKGERVGKP